MAEADQQAQLLAEEPPSDREVNDIEHDAVAEETPAHIKDRELVLKELQGLTRKVLAQTGSLEKALEHDSVVKSLEKSLGLDDLIRTAGMARTLQEPLFDLKPTPPSSHQQAAHLNLFAPGGLNVTTKTKTGMTNNQANIIHQVRVTAPAPWPPHVFSAGFEVNTNPEDLKVDSITYTETNGRATVSAELHHWIQNRLSHDLVRTDLAGLVWGMGMYFQAAVERAQVFYTLHQKYNEDSHNESHTSDPPVIQHPDKLTVDQTHILSKYLTTTSTTLALPATHDDDDDDDDETAAPHRKILISWQIRLTPTSEARHHCEILLSGVPDGLAQAAAALFEQLGRVEGYERAFEAVWGLLDPNEVADGDAGPKGEQGWKRKKRKRIT